MSYRLRREGKPFTMNDARRMHKLALASAIKEIRTDFGWLVRQERVPPHLWVTVTVTRECRTRTLPDLCAEAYAAKAAIDALTDTGVIPDDTLTYLHAVTFTPAIHTGADALVLVIAGEAAPRPSR